MKPEELKLSFESTTQHSREHKGLARFELAHLRISVRGM
jgi:hypothetical protein